MGIFVTATHQVIERSVGELDIAALHEEIVQRSDKINAGDLKSVEAMLFDQAQSLQAGFTAFAERAALNAGEYINAKTPEGKARSAQNARKHGARSAAIREVLAHLSLT